jgi:hypothetical protein
MYGRVMSITPTKLHFYSTLYSDLQISYFIFSYSLLASFGPFKLATLCVLNMTHAEMLYLLPSSGFFLIISLP